MKAAALWWDTTAPPQLVMPGLVLRWVHSGSRWRARLIYGVLLWHLLGALLLGIAGPAIADPTTTPAPAPHPPSTAAATPTTSGGAAANTKPGGDNKPKKPDLADPSLFGWINVKDSSNIPVSQYFIAVDEGNVASVLGIGDDDKSANAALAPILQLEYGTFKIICQLALWVIGYGLSFKWMSFIAQPFDKLGQATETLTGNAGLLMLGLTAAGAVAGFAVVRGHISKAAYQIGSAAIVTAFLATMFAHPVASLIGPDGYLAKARDVGISSAVDLTHASGIDPVGSKSGIDQLQTALADEFLRTPTQLLNFNASADKNGCKGVWNAGIRSGNRDKLKDDIAKCGASGKKMKYAADHLTGDRLASMAFMNVLALILLTFCCYLIGKIVLTTVILLSHAVMLPIVGAGGVVAGGLQGTAFKCLCNIGLGLIKLPMTVVYAGAYAALLHSMLEVEGDPTEILLLATVLLVIAMFAFRRISAGLHNGHGNVLNFLNRGGGGKELPKPPMPSVMRRAGSLAVQGTAAALGVPPSATAMAMTAARGLNKKVRSGSKGQQLAAGTNPATAAQQQWWAQQHQWYGAATQWAMQSQQAPSPATSGTSTSSAAGAGNPMPSAPTGPSSAVRLLYGPRGEVLREVPPMHPAVAGAVGAMPRHLQSAASLPALPAPPAHPRPAPSSGPRSSPPPARPAAARPPRPTPAPAHTPRPSRPAASAPRVTQLLNSR